MTYEAVMLIFSTVWLLAAFGYERGSIGRHACLVHASVWAVGVNVIGALS